MPGAQPEIFQRRGSFVELGQFDKFFVKHTKKRAGKNFEGFSLLDTVKVIFRKEDSTQEWTQLGLFFQNQDTFFDFQKKAGGGLLPQPPGCTPGCRPGVSNEIIPATRQQFSLQN